MKPKIILFTDTHFGEDISNKGEKEGINTHGNTQKLLLRLNEKISKIQNKRVINLGDLVYGKSLEEKERRTQSILDVLSSTKEQLYHLIGNHELYITNKKDIEKITHQSSKVAFNFGGYRHIITDIEKGELSWQMPEQTLAWLDRELQSSQKSIVYGHCPITQEPENLSYYHKNNPEKAFLTNSQEVRELLEKYKCKMYINGHTHFEYRTNIHGVERITVPSFSEDNNGKPNGKFAVLDLDSLSLKIESVYN